MDKIKFKQLVYKIERAKLVKKILKANIDLIKYDKLHSLGKNEFNKV